jgi:hypothetical protein
VFALLAYEVSSVRSVNLRQLFAVDAKLSMFPKVAVPTLNLRHLREEIPLAVHVMPDMDLLVMEGLPAYEANYIASPVGRALSAVQAPDPPRLIE